MGWKATNVSEQRMQFVIRAASGQEAMSVLRLGVRHFPANGIFVAPPVSADADLDGAGRAESASASQSAEDAAVEAGTSRGSARADGLGCQEAPGDSAG